MSDICIRVNNQQTLFPLDEAQIVAAIRSVLDAHDVATAEISVAVVDDTQIHLLNRKHLDHDYPTDVLSFLYETTHDAVEGKSIDGELVVSSDTARQVGREHGMQEHDELLLYVIHGALHLVGLDDDTPRARLEMRSQERHHLRRFGIEFTEKTMEMDANAETRAW